MMNAHLSKTSMWPRSGAAVLALVIAGLPAVAAAQDAVKPEVMLLLDSSSSMEWIEGGEADPTCSAPGANNPDWNLGYQKTRMSIAQEVLTGTPTTDYWCVRDDRGGHVIQGDQPHFRAMCCTAAGDGRNCARWTPCGNDNGQGALDDGVDVIFGANFDTDGLIYENRELIKFGFMTFDGRAQVDGNEDTWSYLPGVAEFDVPQAIADNVGRATTWGLAATGVAGNQPLARGVTRVNLGIRDVDALLGRLISGNRGVPGQRNAAVDERAASVSGHNEIVIQEIRALTPLGPTPIAPMLHDALEYYRAQALQDPAAQCRRRVAVLITDGMPSDYYGGQGCAQEADCGPGGRCVPWPRNNGAGAVLACRYPEGFPYETSEAYAGRLYNQGVPVLVVGFNVDEAAKLKGRDIARAGSPGFGPGGRPGFFFASNKAELRDALNRVRNAVMAGLRSRSRPLILRPGPGDRLVGDIRQWRLFGFSEVPGSADDFWYGHLERSDMGCEAQREDPNRADPLVELGTTGFENRLAQRQDNEPRRTVSLTRDRGRPLAVTGAAQSMYAPDGRLGGAIPENDARLLADTPAGDFGADVNGVPNDDPLLLVGNLLHGFFGERGLPLGVNGLRGQRQLGAILETDLVAITPPAAGVASPAYDAFATAHQNRPTLVAAGANDGMVHIFRADNADEVLSFVPRAVWDELQQAAERRTVDGPLETGDLAECRALGGGRPGCPAEAADIQFRTMLVGGIGNGGPGIFGIDLANIDALAQAAPAAPLDINQLFNGASAQRPYLWDVTDEDVAELGNAVSRPLLTHVRVNGEIQGAVIVGCGADRAANVVPGPGLGRCVLVINAITGGVIRKLTTADVPAGGPSLDLPMVGWPVAFPGTGVAPAQRAYIGDHAGRLWRVDLRDPDPADWSIDLVWPTGDAEKDEGYVTGGPVVGRPSLTSRENGKLVVVFLAGTAGKLARVDNEDRGFAVSLTDHIVIEANGNTEFVTDRNWVFPLGPDEYPSGAPITRDGTSYFTTIQPSDGVCSQARGRIYGVHYLDTYRDQDGAPAEYAVPGDSRRLNVKPQLPVFNADGTRDANALAYVLPPGRVAYGLAVVSTPSCRPGEAESTELIVNLADEEMGARGRVQDQGMSAEQVKGGTLQTAALDGKVHTKERQRELAICLDCDADGNVVGRPEKLGPFPSVITYWGSSFAE